MATPEEDRPVEPAGRGLALLSAVGRILDAVTDGDEGVLDAVAAACVPAFADLCLLMIMGAEGEVRAAASGPWPGSGLPRPERWVEVAADLAGVDEPVLAVGDRHEAPQVGALRARLGAGSLLVAPVRAGGATLGWLVAATGADRRGLAGPDLQVGAELGRRLGAAIRRVASYRLLQASARQQARVAHDLNNLLTVVLGYSDLLSRGIDDPQLRSLAGEIGSAARRAAALTQELLESSVRASADPLTRPAGDGPGDGRGAPGGVAAGDGPAVAVGADPGDVGSMDGEVWPPGRTLAGRVLYVEDEPALRQAGQEALVTAGLDVVAAESAEMALTIMERDPSFDALVTDIALPGLTGVQLTRALRPTHPDLRVLFVTGYSGEADADHTPAPGDPVLRKPYRPDALRLQVAELLERGPGDGRGPGHGS